MTQCNIQEDLNFQHVAVIISKLEMLTLLLTNGVSEMITYQLEHFEVCAALCKVRTTECFAQNL
jgi:hypothetical protein